MDERWKAVWEPQQRARVVIVQEGADDPMVKGRVRRYCARKAARVVIELAPGTLQERDVAACIFLALGQPVTDPWHRALHDRITQQQLELWPTRWEEDAPTGQLTMFDGFARVEELRRYLNAYFSIGEAAWLLRVSGVTEVYVVSAEALEPRTWSLLADLAGRAETVLSLILAGRSPTRSQLRALNTCRVTSREGWAQRRRRTPQARAAAPPWWSRRNYQAQSSVTSLPARFIAPQQRESPVRVVAPPLTWRLFEDVARQLSAELADEPARSFLVPISRRRIPPDALATAFRRVLERTPGAVTALRQAR